MTLTKMLILSFFSLSVKLPSPTLDDTKKAEIVVENLKVDNISNKINKLNPLIKNSLSKKLSRSILKYSKVFGTNPFLSIAIAMQESSLEQKHRRISNKITDLGIFQINIKAVKAYHLDYKKLFSHDVDYSVRSHMLILKDKIKMCKNVKDGWACYHSKNKNKRKMYASLVRRFGIN